MRIAHDWRNQLAPAAAAIALLVGVDQCVAASNAALDSAIASWAKEPVAPAHEYASVDLNDDGTADVVVFVTDRNYCGSGGCTMLVLRGEAGAFHLVSTSTVTRKPVFVLPETRNGWHTLVVSIAGGGGQPAMVFMRFAGGRYPRNPTMQPKAAQAALTGARKLEFVR
jgi:hypothetical protein